MTTKTKILLAIGLLAFVTLQAQSSFTVPTNPVIRHWEGRPTGTVNVCGGLDCWLQHYDISAHGTTGTWTITHGGTACGGSACTIDDTVGISANTSYHVELGGVYCSGGCSITSTGTIDIAVRYSLVGGVH